MSSAQREAGRSGARPGPQHERSRHPWDGSRRHLLAGNRDALEGRTFPSITRYISSLRGAAFRSLRFLPSGDAGHTHVPAVCRARTRWGRGAEEASPGPACSFADGAGRGRPLRPDRQRFVRARGRGSGDRPRGGGPLPLPCQNGRNGPVRAADRARRAPPPNPAGRRAPRLSVGGAVASPGRT